MPITDYDELFITEPRNADQDYVEENNEGDDLPNISPGLAYASGRDFAGSKIFTTSCFISESSERTFWVPEHQHEHDEIIIWQGLDPDNPSDLGAELYMTIEGQERTTRSSGSVYVPAGTNHCPLGWNYIDRPFMFTIIYLNPSYHADN